LNVVPFPLFFPDAPDDDKPDDVVDG